MEEIRAALLEAGLKFLAAYDAFTENPPEENSERIYVIAGEQGKTAGVQL